MSALRWSVIGLGIMFGLAVASSASINRADIHVVSPRRRAIVLNVTSDGTLLKIGSGQNLALQGASSRVVVPVPVAKPKVNAATKKEEREPTAVVFINDTDSTIFIQQQPSTPEKRRAACTDKLNTTQLLALCATSKPDTPGARACEEVKALVDKCVADLTFDVATIDNL